MVKVVYESPTIERLPAILMAMPDNLPALRDWTLWLLGYAGAFRRGELVALDVAEMRFTSAGICMDRGD